MLFVLIVGVTGFMYFERFNLLEAFYMTIITVATVGFQEVHPLSDAGKLFTAFLIIISIGTYAVAISVITTYIVDGELFRYLKERKVKKEIGKLSGHVIVCGYGRNGKQACRELAKKNVPFIVIENHPDVAAALKDNDSMWFLEGNAIQDEVLIEAGIKHAKALITTLPEDADNVYVTLTAREMNSKLLIISRASDDSSEKKLRRAGANNVIMPDKVGGAHMAGLVVKPDVLEFLDHITGQGNNGIALEELTFENLPETLQNKSIRNLEIRNKTGANIVGLKTADGEYFVNPSPETTMKPNSKLFVLGTKDQIEELRKIFKED